MDKSYREIYENLLKCLVRSAEWPSYMSRLCKKEITNEDVIDISRSVRNKVEFMSREITGLTSSIRGLQSEMARAANNVIMFESAIAEYTSTRW